MVVLQVKNREQRLGGASNVCYMLSVLSADVTCAGVIGDDLPGQAITRLLEKAGIDTQLVLRCPDRVTTQKERFVGRSGSGLPWSDSACRYGNHRRNHRERRETPYRRAPIADPLTTTSC